MLDTLTYNNSVSCWLTPTHLRLRTDKICSSLGMHTDRGFGGVPLAPSPSDPCCLGLCCRWTRGRTGPYLSDFVISSYTPTISALTHSRSNSAAPTADEMLVRSLLISQPSTPGLRTIPATVTVGLKTRWKESIWSRCCSITILPQLHESLRR